MWWLAFMALKGLEKEAEIIEIMIQLNVNCHCDKCHEQVHSAMNDNNTDIWPVHVILRRIPREWWLGWCPKVEEITTWRGE